MRKKFLLVCQLVLLLFVACPLCIRAEEVTDESLSESTEDNYYEDELPSLDLYYQANSLNELKKLTKTNSALYEFYLDKANTTESGYVIYEDVLLDYVGTSTKLTIPSNVTRIYGLNFDKKNQNVKQVTIPASVTDIRNSFNCSGKGTKIIFSKRNGNPLSIGNYCFSNLGDENAHRPVIPKETTDIGYKCFLKCNLVDVKIPDSITVLHAYSFSSDLAIRMEIPKSVKKIEDHVFSYDGEINLSGTLATVTVPNSVKSFGKKCFDVEYVICNKGSAAEKYCKKNQIHYTTHDLPEVYQSTYYVCEGSEEYLPLYVWGLPKYLKYSTKNKSCAKAVFDYRWYVIGKKEGTTTLTATYEGKTYNAKIVVLKKTESNRVKAAVNNVTTSKMTKYEKALSLCDWLSNQCEYDYEYLYYGKKSHKYSPHTSQAALLDGVAVCDGYANACKLLFDKAGLENKIIHGTINGMGHAWNLVKVDGGWIHLDTTNLIFGSDAQAKECGLKWSASSYPKATVRFGP